MTNKTCSTILLVDDHPIMRKGLSYRIGIEDDFEIVGEADSIHKALEIVENVKPQVAIIDISLKNESGFELIQQLTKEYSDLKILVLSMHQNPLYAERAIRLGAKGYMVKHEDDDVLIAALRSVIKGDIYLSKQLSSTILTNLLQPSSTQSSVESLTKREMEVFRLIGEGLTSKQIAQKLFLSKSTIDTHRANIRQKLNINSNSELARYAFLFSLW